MKKITTIILGLSSLSLLCNFANFSCTNNTKPKSWDGSNWKGIIRGSFSKKDISIDKYNKTITYNDGSRIASLDLVIPESVKYEGEIYQVKLGKYCFADNLDIVGIVEFNAQTRIIPEGCFEECDSITDIIFNSYPLEFERYAFHNCLSLVNIWVREGKSLYKNWTSRVKVLGESCFEGCTLSGDLFFSEDLGVLGPWAFANCSHIENVNLSLCNKIKKLEMGCFAWCSWLENVFLPPDLSEICDYAFFRCEDLKELTFQENENDLLLGSSVFFACEKLTKFNNVGIIEKIGTKCFVGTKDLSFLPWNILKHSETKCSIDFQAFVDCDFSYVSFDPEKVEDVGNFAFSNNSSLSYMDFSKYSETEPPNWKGQNIFKGVPESGLIVLSGGGVISDSWKSFFTKNDIVLGTNNWQITFTEH